MEIVRSPGGSITFQTMVSLTVPAGTSMLEAGNLLMDQINAAGAPLTGHLVESRDAGLQPVERGGRRFTAKHNKEVRHVETPYGCAVVWRRAFQSSLGGVCYYPMDREVAAVKVRYPDAVYVGLSDGAADLLPWLARHTSVQVLDFYHASGYVHAAAAAFCHESVPKGEGADWWAQEACRHLRYDKGAAQALLEAFEARLASPRRLSGPAREALQKTTTCFRNNVGRMDYAAYEAAGLPLGSGVTEAGCKLLVKKRLCGPGMSWSFSMAGYLLNLRALAHSAGGRWQSLWKEILTNKTA